MFDCPNKYSQPIVHHREAAGGLSAHAFSASAVTRHGQSYLREVFRGVWLAGKRWQEDDASAMAASVAYYLSLSLFPMLLLLTAGLGIVLKFTELGHDAELKLLEVVKEHCSPSLETQVRAVLSQLQTHSMVGGPFGLVTAIMAAIGVFYQFERAFDRIWRIAPHKEANWLRIGKRVLTERLSAFCMLASVGLSVVLILAANFAISGLHAWMTHYRLPGAYLLTLVEASTTMLLNALVFGMLYRWLPKRPIRWSHALRGGLLASIVWEVGRQLLGAVLIGMKYTAAYGAIGSFIALLLWCYWGVSIIFFGAEYVQVLSKLDQAAVPPPAAEKHDARVSTARTLPSPQATASDRNRRIVPRRVADSEQRRY